MHRAFHPRVGPGSIGSTRNPGYGPVGFKASVPLVSDPDQAVKKHAPQQGRKVLRSGWWVLPAVAIGTTLWVVIIRSLLGVLSG